jgi:hypothetical protein
VEDVELDVALQWRVAGGRRIWPQVEGRGAESAAGSELAERFDGVAEVGREGRDVDSALTLGLPVAALVMTTPP